jgi:hypothetical protein
MKPSDKERAKDIIVAIIREAGGTFTNKTNLFKAFWLAHVKYARSHCDSLSDWPIVRMPNGPGIDNFNALLGELMMENRVATKQVKRGDFDAFQFKLTDGRKCGLDKRAMQAIKSGVASVVGRSAESVSDSSHKKSRSWRAASNGERLDVLLDAIPDDEYREREKRLKRIDTAFRMGPTRSKQFAG